jgi:hypothetical protein
MNADDGKQQSNEGTKGEVSFTDYREMGTGWRKFYLVAWLLGYLVV